MIQLWKIRVPDAPTQSTRAEKSSSSVGRCPPGAAECNADDHCHLQPTRDDTPVGRSGLVGVRSAALYAEEGQRLPDGNLSGEVEWSG